MNTRELWVVVYLNNWEPKGVVYPEVHSIHETSKEAEAERASKISPEQYWVRRGLVRSNKM